MIEPVQLSCLSSGAQLGAGTTDATPTESTHKGTAPTAHRHLGPGQQALQQTSPRCLSCKMVLMQMPLFQHDRSSTEGRACSCARLVTLQSPHRTDLDCCLLAQLPGPSPPSCCARLAKLQSPHRRPHLLPACSAAWPLSTQLLWESAGCASFLVPLALESDGKSCTGWGVSVHASTWAWT